MTLRIEDTQHRTVAVKSDIPRIQTWLNAVVKRAFWHAAEAERVVESIRNWVAYQRHMIDTCGTPDCDDCATRTSMLTSLTALLPQLPERRGDSAGGGEDMGTRVTRLGGNEDEREWKFRGDDDEAAD